MVGLGRGIGLPLLLGVGASWDRGTEGGTGGDPWSPGLIWGTPCASGAPLPSDPSVGDGTQPCPGSRVSQPPGHLAGPARSSLQSR